MKLALILKTIQFEYTLFALPFAGVGALLAARGIPKAHDIFWIILAVVGARNIAMGLNRLIDREIDAANPRTAQWPMPRGLVSTGEMFIFILISLGLLVTATLQLHPLCLYFLPLIFLILFSYSYVKRFSWLCHLVLGLALAWAPLGSWIAIRGTLEITPFLLGLGVMFWIAGFDTIYACLDVQFDRQQGLYSIPACFGITTGLFIPALFHLLALLLFFLVGLTANLGIIYYLGIFLSGTILTYQHSLVSLKDLSKINSSFFSLNKIVSLIIFSFTLLDILNR